MGLFVSDGTKLLEEAVKFYPGLDTVILSDGVEANVPESVKVIRVPGDVMESISPMQSPQGALFLCRLPEKTEFVPQKGMLILDGIQDPGNLGTILRIADWFGIKAVFAAPDTVDLFNPKVVQSTMGAIFRVKMHYVDLPSLAKILLDAGGKLYGTFLDGKNIYQRELSNGEEAPSVIVIGNESNGISDAMAELVSDRLYIPPYPADDPGSESLNAAIATSITVAEFRRRKY
jgi:TrmH family RNA methyltransferase